MTSAFLAPEVGAGHDLFVLHARPLRDTAKLDHTARFTDDLWPLAPAVLQRHQNALALNFQSVPACYRRVTKELCYAMLSGPLPAAERRLSISTVHRALGELKRFYAWSQTRPQAASWLSSPARISRTTSATCWPPLPTPRRGMTRATLFACSGVTGTTSPRIVCRLILGMLMVGASPPAVGPWRTPPTAFRSRCWGR
jgi:hypothetical protein